MHEKWNPTVRWAVKNIRVTNTKENMKLIEEFLPRELKAYRNVRHRNIVLYREAFNTDSDHYIVLELVEGPNLQTELYGRGGRALPFSNREGRCWFGQLAGAVEYLHSKNVAHRDIKLDNILLDRQRQIVKLCDMGLATDLDMPAGTLSDTHCGSPGYSSPELLDADRPAYNPFAADIWALGVVLYSLLVRELPFHCQLHHVLNPSQLPLQGATHVFSLILMCDLLD